MTAPFPNALHTIDDYHLGRPGVIATYLLEGDQPALVDPGPTSVLPTVEAGIAARGLVIEDLSAIFLTHIHLDHAGATGALVARNPKLRVYVHQRGAPHIVAPERLLRSAGRIYGDAMERLFGVTLPVPAENVIALSGGEQVSLGGHTLRAFDAPGHANHHLIYFEEGRGVAFVGDTGGIRLPDQSFILPATVPPEFDLDAWNRSLDLLRSLHPQWLLLTHFGAFHDPEEHIECYRERLADWTAFVGEQLAQGGDDTAHVAELYTKFRGELQGTAETQYAYEQASNIEMNWSGIARYWRTRPTP